MMDTFALVQSFPGYLTDTVALAAVAVLGYLVGRRNPSSLSQTDDVQLGHELLRAAQIAKELQQIAGRIRQDVASHQANISQFNTKVSTLQTKATDDGWQALSAEAETLLVPTMKLATDLSLAYDQLRKQSLQLMNFAGSRTDPDTGIHNRRAMEEQLEVLLSLHKQNASRFSLALFSLDCEGENSDRLFGEFVELLESCARDTDVVARYSNKEFVVLMPQTSLAGGVIFSERLLKRADTLNECVVAGGIVEVASQDDAEKLLSRADSALYSARANGYNCLYKHNGRTLREHEIERFAEASDLGLEAVSEPEEQPTEAAQEA